MIDDLADRTLTIADLGQCHECRGATGNRTARGATKPLTAKSLKATLVLANPGEVLRIRCGPGDAPRVTIRLIVASGRTVNAELNCKSVRKAQATIRELGADSVACVLHGRLDAKDALQDAGFQVMPKTPKP
jgi:hypothetical protein